MTRRGRFPQSFQLIVQGSDGIERAAGKSSLRNALRMMCDLRQIFQELRYGARMLGRNPGFTAVVVATLALGLGMTTAMFSVINGVLLKPLPYPNPDRLVWVSTYDPEWPPDGSFSRSDYELWKGRARSFNGFAAYGNEDRALVYRNESSTAQIASITGDFWSICGAAPAVGRLFDEQERDTLVLSWNLFQNRFGGDAKVIGNIVTVDGHAFTVVGVLPNSFRFLFPPEAWAGDPVREMEAYIPIPEGHEAPGYPIVESSDSGPAPVWVRAVGRLGPQASFSKARAEMEVIYNSVIKHFPRPYGKGDKLLFLPFTERVVGATRLAVTLLFVAAGFVLLIASANFASLLMARASGRAREVAVRKAFGASRMHLTRQLLVESVELSILGGAGGLVIAKAALALALHIGANAVPRLADVRIDGEVLLFTLVVSLATGCLFGLAPLVYFHRDTVNQTLKEESATSSAGATQLRFRRLLVAMEFALAITLLTGAGLMLKSFHRMNAFPSGFEPGKLLVVSISHSGAKYFRQWPKQSAYIEELFARIDHLPGVQAYGIHSGTFYQSLEMVGDTPHPRGQDAFAVRYVSAGFFRAMGAPLIQGRWPSDAEWRALKNVVLVNHTFASRFTGGSIVGKHIRGGVVNATVIGVVADFKDFQLDAEPDPQVYVAYPMAPGVLTIRLFLRISDHPKALESALPQLVAGIDPDVPIRIDTLSQLLSGSITPRRFNMYLFEAFAGTALLLALIGIYGVMAYLVKQRTREIGIRMALGAQRQGIIGMVVWQGMKIVLAGTAAGIVAALGLTHLITSMLYETKSTDPVTFVLVTMLLGATALVACCYPAFKASLTDPIVALRHD
jgi:putative ABC transport system permease protein